MKWRGKWAFVLGFSAGERDGKERKDGANERDELPLRCCSQTRLNFFIINAIKTVLRNLSLYRLLDPVKKSTQNMRLKGQKGFDSFKKSSKVIITRGDQKKKSERRKRMMRIKTFAPGCVVSRSRIADKRREGAGCFPIYRDRLVIFVHKPKCD